MISLGSDNHSGIHPDLLNAMLEVNADSAASYGQDPWSQKLKKRCAELFKAADSFLVFNGTAANVLCLQASLKSYESALVTDIAHLHVDECGAPEKTVGCKIIPVKSFHGKFIFENLVSHIERQGDQHFSQVKVISVTQPTEYGTLYSVEELKAIKALCRQHSLFLHIDGARFANAAQAMDLSLSELADFADILSFGGTKNGMLAGELVVIRKPELTKGFRFYRKQFLQLPSKTRFFAAPFLRYLQDDLWKDIAAHENQRAQELRQLIELHTELEITQPTQANSVFFKIPRAWLKPLRKKFFFYVWNENTFEVRIMMSFDTTSEHLQDFVAEIKKIASDPNTESLPPRSQPSKERP